MEVAASIIAILQLSSKVVGYLTAVKDASKERTICAVEVTNLHSLLLNLRFHLEGQDTDELWFVAIRALAIENGPLDQFKQALETLQARMTDRGRLQMAKDALLWKFEKEEIASILYRVERLKSLVEIALLRDHFKLSQAIHGDVQTLIVDTQIIKGNAKIIEENTKVIMSDIDSAKLHKTEADHRKILEWLSSSNYPAQHSDIMKRRQEGTGQWFLDASQFSTWLSEPRATLFCPGIPGAGKTVVAAIAIEHLLTSVQSSTVGVAYVFCDYKAQEEDNASLMLAAILKQLAQTQIEPVERLHKLHADKGTKPKPDEISSALRDVISLYTTVFIVVDALDECQGTRGSWRNLLDRIYDLQAICNVSLLATSRLIPDIEKSFKDKKALTLAIQADNHDVKRFVAGQLYRLPRCIQNDAGLQLKVQEKVSEAVGGMFLLARLYVDSLLDKRSKAKVISALQGLQGGSEALDKAYDEALDRIQGQLPGDVALAKRVLSWITNAMRPLKVTEICHALAVEPGTNTLDLDNVSDIDDLVSVCAGLVSIDEESNIVRLVHYTTQTYFEQKLDTWKPNAQLDIAETCITYLSFDQFNAPILDEKQLWDRLAEHRFLSYATQHWGNHAFTVQKEVCGAVQPFLRHHTLPIVAEQFASWVVSDSAEVLEGRTALHIMARFGLRVLLEEFLSTKTEHPSIDFNAKDSLGRSPLSLAVQSGHAEVVGLLLANRASIELINADFGTPLYTAALFGHEATLRLLLDNGADIHSGESLYGTALQAAAVGGHEHIMRLLYSRGADIYVEHAERGTPLSQAALRGHANIVRYLLDEGADHFSKIGFDHALQLASQAGHISVVQLLLDAGADTGAHDRIWATALYWASRRNKTQIMELLLDHGADINERSRQYGTALHAAIFGGAPGAVRLLIEKGVEIDAEGGAHMHALHAGLFSGVWKYEVEKAREVVQLLLDAGADFSAHNGSLSFALLVASSRGHIEVVEKLLDARAGARTQDQLFTKAFQTAAYGGRFEMLEFLMAREPPIPFQDPYQRSLLWWAAAGGSLSTVKSLILQYGFDPQEPNKYGQTPLWVARKAGNAEVSIFLAENSAQSTADKDLRQVGDGASSYLNCDVCTLGIYGDAISFQCKECYYGDWDMCADCKDLGASCEDPAHALVKRAFKNGDIIEVSH